MIKFLIRFSRDTDRGFWRCLLFGCLVIVLMVAIFGIIAAPLAIVAIAGDARWIFLYFIYLPFLIALGVSGDGD
jgi:hypothetical protein